MIAALIPSTLGGFAMLLAFLMGADLSQIATIWFVALWATLLTVIAAVVREFGSDLT